MKNAFIDGLTTAVSPRANAAWVLYFAAILVWRLGNLRGAASLLNWYRPFNWLALTSFDIQGSGQGPWIKPPSHSSHSE